MLLYTGHVYRLRVIYKTSTSSQERNALLTRELLAMSHMSRPSMRSRGK